ncbi:MAG: DUF4143 domain-containing protein [Elusimicrobiota bacterium]
MVNRGFWIDSIERDWQKKNVIWLTGVRRSGKTFLTRNLPAVEYFDCELPSVRNYLADPEAFLKKMRGKRVVIDEIHRLGNPSELLKLAADHFPEAKVVATGSSSLSASSKFKDTLTGRKTQVWLTPMLLRDLADFGREDLPHRLLHGGLPPHFLSPAFPEREIQDWMDDYWAKDIQELFRVERRSSFLRFVELVMARSGGIFEATAFAAPCEVSRNTIANYLSVLEATFVAHVVRPFSGRSPAEIISAPKVYAFDTGFVCCFKGIPDLRPDDKGPLWEHLVLNEICGRTQSRKVNYWRDKRGHEVDFVIPKTSGRMLAVECKWSQNEFSSKNLKVFLKRHASAECLAVCADSGEPITRDCGGIPVTFLGLREFSERLG